MTPAEMTAKIADGEGFIAALDQSGGSTPKALKGYGIEEGAWSNDEQMFGLIHDMRARIITSPAFTGDKVIGAILFERTMNGQAGGKPVPQALADKGVVPFLKIDKGLEDEANGVQLMKPNPGLDELLAHAAALGIFGTKERSVINLANREGIAAVVAQQFEVAQQVLARAQGDAAAFDKVFAQYKLAPEVTRRRMYYETMERVLSKVDKTVVEADGVTPYLPLPQVQRQAQEGAAR